MQRIGLTGGIGSGKTTVSRLFEMLDIPVFYADLEAHRIRCRTQINEKVVRYFGTDILTNTCVDRRKLAHIVFNNKEALLWLNNLLHPLVKEEFEIWCETRKQKQSPIVVMDSALIFEAGFECLFDKIIVVDAPQELRISRVASRENISELEVLQRINKQMLAEEKCRKADLIIRNDECHSLIEQILMLQVL